MNIDEERKLFQQWIMNNWNPKYHNFSLKDDGKYYYSTMQDCFDVWLGAKGYDDIHN